MSRRLRAGLLSAILLTLVPSSAVAATHRVDPTGADGAFRTIGAAIAAASPLDTIAVAKGDYSESVVVPEVLTGLQINGAEGARVLGGSGAEDVLRIEAPNVNVRTLVISAPPAARSAVRVGPAATANLIGMSVSRASASSSPEPLIDIAGGGSVSESIVAQQGGAVGAPAIAAYGEEGSEVIDSEVFSATGPAFLVSEADSNLVQRSTLLSTSAGADAVRLNATQAGDRALTVDSSELLGGRDAAGVRVTTRGAPGIDITRLTMRHTTVFGAARGVVVDGTADSTLGIPTGSAGSIIATVAGSIVREGSVARGNPGSILAPGNNVSLAFTDTDAPGVAAADRNASASVSVARGRFTPDAARLFGNGLHLRADAPVIDQGPESPVPSQSATDIDGEPRKVGAATDMGADEFVNLAPRAGLTASTTTPAQRETVTFTSTATDPNAGDQITTYHWDFGDGERTSTSVPTVDHAFARPGEHRVSTAAVDRGGLASDIASIAVTVRDADPPTVTITSPKAGAKLALNRRKRAPRRLVMQGTDSDTTGVAGVEVSLRRGLRGRTCRHYTGRRLTSRGSCTRLRWLKASLDGETWRLVTRRGLRLPAGRYELRVRATDVGGVVSEPSAQAGSLVRFTVKKRPRRG